MSQARISLTPEQLQTLKNEVGQLKNQIHDLSDRCVRIETLLEHFGLENAAKISSQESVYVTAELLPLDIDHEQHSEEQESDVKEILYDNTELLDSSLDSTNAQGKREDANSEQQAIAELEDKPEVDDKVMMSWAILYQGSLPPDARPCYKGAATAFFDEEIPGPLAMWLCLTMHRAGYRLGAKYYNNLAKIWDKFNGTGPSLSDGVNIFDFLQFRETLLEFGGSGFHAYALRHGLIQPWQMDEQGRLSPSKLMENGQWGAQYGVMCKYRWQNPEQSRRFFHEYRDSMDERGLQSVLNTFHIHPSVLDETIVFEMLHSDAVCARETALSVIRSISHSAYSIACTRVIKLCLGYNVRLHKWLMPERAEIKGFSKLGITMPKTRSLQDQAWLRCEVMRGMDWEDLMQLTQTQEPRETITRLQDFAEQTGLAVAHVENMLAERIAVAQDSVAAKTLMQLRKTKTLDAYARLLPLLQPWDINLNDIEHPMLVSNLFFSVEPHFDPLSFTTISKEWAQVLLSWLEQKILEDESFVLDDNLKALMGLYLPIDVSLDNIDAAIDKLSKKRNAVAKERALHLSAQSNEMAKYLQVRRQLDSLQNAYLVQ